MTKKAAGGFILIETRDTVPILNSHKIINYYEI